MIIRNFWRRFLHVVTSFTVPCITVSDENSCKQMATQSDCPVPKSLRLLAVPGFDNRKNDVLFCRHLTSDPSPESRVVFFGGDVQDYPENMSAHRDNCRYLRWNLENTAELLSKKFSKSDIFVVKPSRMQFKTFSCYDNFVESSNVGAPNHVPNNNAIIHLKTLIHNADKSAQEKIASVQPNTESPLPLTLIGFSKGCIVLNQIVYELHLGDSDTEIKSFISTITDIYWLDGGHPGGSNTWITKQDLLQKLTDLDIKVHVFVTPHQIKDQRRPWIGKEEKLFTDTLRKQNAKIERKVLFENEEMDTALHFQVLDDF